MTFAAIHADAGRIDATLPDLGCGLTWDQVHKMRPRVALRCPDCEHGVHAKVSSRGLRHFAHDPGRPPDCTWLNESFEHHQLKLMLATAVRAAGWQAELEVTGPDGAWRADVLASSPHAIRLIAWEAQLSPITDDDIRYRTTRYNSDGVEVCWVSPAWPTWIGVVPSIRVAERSGTAVVVDGTADFHFKQGRWQLPPHLTLVEFIRGVQDRSWVFHDVLPRYRQIRVDERYSRRHRLWVSPASIEAEARHEVMRQRQDAWKRRQQEAEAARREAERRKRELEKRQQEAERAAELDRLRQEEAQRSAEHRRQLDIWLEQERQRRAAEEQRRQAEVETAERQRQQREQMEAAAAAQWLAEISETRAHDLRTRVAEHLSRHEASKTVAFDPVGPTVNHAYGTAIYLRNRLYGVLRPSPASLHRLPDQVPVFVLNTREAQLFTDTGMIAAEQVVAFDFPDTEQLSLL